MPELPNLDIPNIASPRFTPPVKTRTPFYLVSMLVFASLAGILFWSYNYLNELTLNKNEDTTSGNATDEVSYYGRVQYVDPRMYPEDNVSYVLVDSGGKELYLLKSTDDKLPLAEGHYAKVYGSITRSADNKKDILMVTKIVLSGLNK